jgi:ABC-type multidrug transport system permease subunit
MWAMVVKEFRELRRDRLTVAMMVVMPIVLLVVFGYAASFNVSTIQVAVVGPDAERLAAQLPSPFELTSVDPAGDEADAEHLIQRNETSTAIVADPGAPVALVDGSELFTAKAAVQAFSQAEQRVPGLRIDVLYNPSLDSSLVLVPGLGGLILLFIGTVVTSLGVVRERQAGTLEQLAVMPVRPWDVFVGKIAPYFAVASVDLVLVIGVGMLLFDVPFNGSVATFAVAAILFLFVTLGLGVLISSVSENQGQAIQLALMILLPQVLLSGIIFPLSSMAPGVRWIGYLLPLTYFNEVAVSVMLKATPFSALLAPIGVLALMAVVVFAAAVIRFARQLGVHRRQRPRRLKTSEAMS